MRDLLVEGHELLAFTNVAGSTLVGIAAVMAGVVVGRAL
jgi:fluoride ion exporter CrcB/FEX